MRYVIADIHGNFELFQKLLKQIDFKEVDELYILGDIIDRGEEPIKLVQYMMAHPEIHMLLGNHENLMLIALEDLSNEEALNHWYRNGGEVTYEQYKSLSEQEQEEVKVFINNLPLYIELKDYLLVHAGVRLLVPNGEWKDIRDAQTRRDLIWMRYDFIHEPTIRDKKVIFGHTQTLEFATPGSIWFGGDKIGVDCGVYTPEKGGRLGCLNLDTMQAVYVG